MVRISKIPMTSPVNYPINSCMHNAQKRSPNQAPDLKKLNLHLVFALDELWLSNFPPSKEKIMGVSPTTFQFPVDTRSIPGVPRMKVSQKYI